MAKKRTFLFSGDNPVLKHLGPGKSADTHSSMVIRPVTILSIWNQTGNTLIQVLISVAIMGIMITGFATMMEHQTRETRALAERVAAIDTTRNLTAALSNSDVCGAMFGSSNLVSQSSMPFDGSSVNVQPKIIPLKSIPSSSSGALPPVAVAGSTASMLSNSLSLQSETSVPSGIEAVITSLNPPMGMLRLNFDESKLVRSIKNLEFPLTFTVSGPANATMITGCSAGNSLRLGGPIPGGGVLQVSATTSGTLALAIPQGATFLKLDATCNSTGLVGTGAWLRYDFQDAGGGSLLNGSGCYSVSQANESMSYSHVLPIPRNAQSVVLTGHNGIVDGFSKAVGDAVFYGP